MKNPWRPTRLRQRQVLLQTHHSDRTGARPRSLALRMCPKSGVIIRDVSFGLHMSEEPLDLTSNEVGTSSPTKGIKPPRPGPCFLKSTGRNHAVGKNQQLAAVITQLFRMTAESEQADPSLEHVNMFLLLPASAHHQTPPVRRIPARRNWRDSIWDLHDLSRRRRPGMLQLPGIMATAGVGHRAFGFGRRHGRPSMKVIIHEQRISR